MPIPYLGTDDDILREYPPEDYRIHHAVVYTDKVSLDLRKRLIKKFGKYEASAFVAPTAVVSPKTVLGNGVAVFHRCVINRGSIGPHCVINTGAIVEHDCMLGSNVFVGSGATLCGGARIGNNVFIGAGCVIRDGIRIADDSVIGMGSLVTKDILSSGTYYGCPAHAKG